MPPPANKSKLERTLEEIVEELGIYPLDAFLFLQEGLSFSVQRMYPGNPDDPRQHRHVSGQQMCEGLRDLALAKWGRLARVVLERWGITCTFDFGRMVFAMIDAGMMNKTDEDSIEDFRNVYDFEAEFEKSYRIPCHS